MNRTLWIHPTFRLALSALLAALALIVALSFARASNLSPPSPRPPTAFASSAVKPRASGERVLRVPVVTATHPGPGGALNNPALAYKIDPALRKRLLTARPDERIPIVIEMRQQADLENASSWVAGADHTDRAAAIVNTLQTAASQSQAGVRAFLAAQEMGGRAGKVRPFWIFNGLAAHVVAADILALATRDDVGLIREDRYRQWIDWNVSRPAGRGSRLSTGAVEWGIAKIRADEVWAALNITGAGVVVANMDTGVDWQHPALQAAYRGSNKGLTNHSGNWVDVTDGGAFYPIDPHGHGTHTMGTLAGGQGVGVAPGARWIAARVLGANGFGFDSWIHAGFQWMLAPNGDPSLAPDVLSNSWSKAAAGDAAFQNDLRVLRSAGIFVVFSNGNGGPRAGSVGSPASLPEAFAAGATDVEDIVAAFSSRGPSPWDEVRPHVSAPGIDVRSSIPGGAYAEASGTSMAAPHVAGTVALMLSANPALTISDTAAVLTGTAIPLSVTIPNNDTGYGRIDAYAAVQRVAGLGAIGGTLTQSGASSPIAGATVSAISIAGTSGTATSDANGRYVRGLASSIYTVTASAFGYLTATRINVVVITGTVTPVDFSLAPLPSGSLRGWLIDAESGQPISGTIVVVNTPVTAPASANGAYSMTLPGGMFELRAIAWGHRVVTAAVTITPGQLVTRDFALPPAPTILLVDSGPWHNASQIAYYRAALDDLSYTYAEHRVKSLLGDAPVSATLAAHDVVIWSAPFDSPGIIGAGDAISAYLSSGGSLFISGQDVGFYDSGLALSWSDYYYERLKTIIVADESGSRELTGAGAFSGLTFSIEGPQGADNQLYPDAIASADPGVTADAFRYANGLLGGQSVGLCLPYRAVNLSFGFEAIAGSQTRRDVLSRTLAYFASPRNAVGMTLYAADDVLIAPADHTVTQVLRLRNIAELGGSDTFTLTAQSPDWSVSLSDASATLDSCHARTITLTIAIPPGTPANVSRSITVTARSSLSPTLIVSDAFVVKSPATALIVDDDRWYDVEGAYQSALVANGVSFDRWDVNKLWPGLDINTPSPERLSWYPFVVWFTGYDWYQPLTEANELTLTQYLDAGGRALISSQDYLAVRGLSDFGRTWLGILDRAEDVTTTLAYGLPFGPFDGIGPLTLVYTYPNYSDALAPYPTATVALIGSHGRPIALTNQEGAGKAMFFAFPFEAIPEFDRAAVMERIVGYLSWLGGSTVTLDRPVAAPGSIVTATVVARNDGPGALASAAFTATLPAGVSLQSGSLAWSGPLAPGQPVTLTFVVWLGGGLPAGSLVTIPVAFADADHAITFHKEARISIGRPDLSASSLSVEANPAHPLQTVTWTLVARNTGLADAPTLAITGLLPIDTVMLSGTLASSVGSASELSGTVKWDGAIPAGSALTITYQMTVPGSLEDRLYFGDALLDDGLTLARTPAWLTVQPQRYYLPQIYKAGSYLP